MESGLLATALCVLVLPGAAFSAEPAPQHPSIAVPQTPSPLAKPSPVPRVVAPLLIGVGESESVAITKGIYEGSLLVQFNAGTGMNPINGSGWACWLWLYDATMGTEKWVEADRLMATSCNRTKPYRASDQSYLR
jgi:hypothetical protein